MAVAVRADCTSTLTRTLNNLCDVALLMGLRFNKDKTKVYHRCKHHTRGTFTWRHQGLPICPPVMTYLGHILALPSYEATTWEMVTTQL